MAANAEFAGAKTVMSSAVVSVSARPAAVTAPSRYVRPPAEAVFAMGSGTVRTVSTMWAIPPWKATSYGKVKESLDSFADDLSLQQ